MKEQKLVRKERELREAPASPGFQWPCLVLPGDFQSGNPCALAPEVRLGLGAARLPSSSGSCLSGPLLRPLWRPQLAVEQQVDLGTSSASVHTAECTQKLPVSFPIMMTGGEKHGSVVRDSTGIWGPFAIKNEGEILHHKKAITRNRVQVVQ